MMDLSIYRLRTTDCLVLCVVCLLALGVIMVQSASANVTAATATAGGWSLYGAGTKQLFFALLAFTAFLLVGRINIASLCGPAKSWRSNRIGWIMAIALIGNIIVLIPHVGLSLNHSRRWLPLGPLTFEPSELAKWAVVVYLAFVLSARPLNLDKFFKGFLPLVLPVGVLVTLVVIQDFGTATLIGLVALAMLLAGRVRWRHLFIVVPPVVAAGVLFVTHTAYRWQRITAFLNPYAVQQKEGYQLIQSLLSFATGGWTGRGLGNGIQKLGYLPEDTTDFIFSVICEELGFFGALLTVALYVGIIYVTWQGIRQRRSELELASGNSYLPDFGRMVAFGIGGMVCLQAVINIAVATVSVPTKGLSLPLISSGGTGLIITSSALGLLLSICREELSEIPEGALPAAA
jgi:cell division protein FtsW